MSNSSAIYNILISNPITSYLEQKGVFPVRSMGGKLWYNCPLPDHEETKPSFVVYTNGEFENFYCFGCGAKYHVINLVSKMEGISFKEAVAKLGNGLVITEFDETIFLEKKISEKFKHPIDAIGTSDILLIMSSYCRLYEEGTGRDEKEVGKIDDFWKIIDQAILDYDLDSISNVEPVLRRGLKKNKVEFEKRKKNRKTRKGKKCIM